MKHILTMDILPRYSPLGPNYINYGGVVKDMVINPNQVPFVILTRNDNKLYYSPNHIYEMNKINGFYNTYISKEDILLEKDSEELMGRLLCYTLNDKDNNLFFADYSNSLINSFYEFGKSIQLSGIDDVNYSALLVNKYIDIKSDRIDIVDNSHPEDVKLITSLTLTGLKKKNSNERDFVGEIACYNDKLIKVDRTNPNSPTVQLLSFNESQYKDDYEKEKRIKLFIYIGEYL